MTCRNQLAAYNLNEAQEQAPRQFKISTVDGLNPDWGDLVVSIKL
jgi:hypothetical protein